MVAHGTRRGNLIYHWKHGWIPLTSSAALSKAHGSHSGAAKILHKPGTAKPNPAGKDFRSMTSAEKVSAAEHMFGTGSKQHRAAIAKFGGSHAAAPGKPLHPDLVKDLRGGSAEKHLVTDASGNTHFTPERAALHAKITQDIVGGHASQQNPAFVMLGGGPASGKTKAAQAAAADFPGAITINPDDIKAMLPEYRQMGPDKAASFTHEESSYLAKQVTAAAIAQRSHVILDAVGDNSAKSVEGKIAAAKAAGYSTHARYVTVPTEVAQARAVSRGIRSGRVVPPTVIADAHKGVSAVFPQVMGQFDTAALHDNTGDWQMVLTARRGQAPVIHNPAAYSAFLGKAG